MDPTSDQSAADGLLVRLARVPSPLLAVLAGTFTLRFSTGLTGALLVNYLADLPKHGGAPVDSAAIGVLSALFFASELILSTPFGLVADRLGHRRIMQLGPAFGFAAVVLTYLTTNLALLGGTRLLEGASTAASVPSILGFIAVATAGDELMRGRAAARFEGATLAGLGFGLVAAGPIYVVFGRLGFLLNAGIYVLSFAIYRFGVPPETGEAASIRAAHPGLARYVAILRSSHVWLLAPTWIAINAAIGLWTSQGIFELRRVPEARFADQLLMGSVGPLSISAGLAVGLLIFFAGLGFWGERFKAYRRTTIIFFGILGGAAVMAAAGVVNHSAGLPVILPALGVVVILGGVFVLAGATPAALGMLADVSEAFPADRGAIMGLYSVFLAVGQIGGSLVGGLSARSDGIDGLLVATCAMLVLALVPLGRLRSVEHRLADGAEGQVALD